MTHTAQKTREAIKGRDDATPEEKAAIAAFDRIRPVLELVHTLIEASGPEGIPSGHLYAALMGFMDLETYQSLIDLMIKSGGITLNNHVLRANK